MTSGAMQGFGGESFDAKKIVETIDKIKATAVAAVPTMYNRIINYYLTGEHGNGLKDKIAPVNAGKDICDISSLRTGLMAGMVCPVKLMSQCVNTLGM